MLSVSPAAMKYSSWRSEYCIKATQLAAKGLSGVTVYTVARGIFLVQGALYVGVGCWRSRRVRRYWRNHGPIGRILPHPTELGGALGEPVPEALREAAKQADLEAGGAIASIVASPDCSADVGHDRGGGVAVLEDAAVKI